MTNPEESDADPAQIDGRFAPEPASFVEQAIVGGELVLVDGWSTATVLSPVASLIWGSFDGTSTIDAISDELSRSTGVDPDEVHREVIGLARELGGRGLLNGVAPVTPEGPDVILSAIPDLEVGEVVDDAAVRGPAGEASLRDHLRGAASLVVNWSTDCGYCWAIADLLAVLVAPLRDAGIRLVLLAAGDEEGNREAASARGIEADLLVRDGAVDPFRAHGTPAAYHLDARAALVEPVVSGSEAVLELAGRLADADPHLLLDDSDSDPVPPGTRYLLTDGTCAPSVGEDGRTGWSGVRAYRMDGYHVGIRHDGKETAEVLDSLFAGRRVRDLRAGPSYSVSLGSRAGSAGGAAPQDLGLLVGGGRTQVRSRHPARVLRALLWHLSDDIFGRDVDRGRMRVQAVAAIRDGRAVLLPPQVVGMGASLQARLARRGFAVSDRSFPEIEPATGDLVVPPPAVEHDPAVLEGLEVRPGTASELAPVREGRYPLVGWGVIHPSEHAVTPFTAAQAAAATLSSAYRTDDVPRRLAELGDLFTRVDGFGLWYHSEEGLVDAVEAAIGARDDSHGASG